jgi:hypothetical protein
MPPKRKAAAAARTSPVARRQKTAAVAAAEPAEETTTVEIPGTREDWLTPLYDMYCKRELYDVELRVTAASSRGAYRDTGPLSKKTEPHVQKI